MKEEQLNYACMILPDGKIKDTDDELQIIYLANLFTTKYEKKYNSYHIVKMNININDAMHNIEKKEKLDGLWTCDNYYTSDHKIIKKIKRYANKYFDRHVIYRKEVLKIYNTSNLFIIESKDISLHNCNGYITSSNIYARSSFIESTNSKMHIFNSKVILNNNNECTSNNSVVYSYNANKVKLVDSSICISYNKNNKIESKHHSKSIIVKKYKGFRFPSIPKISAFGIAMTVLALAYAGLFIYMLTLINRQIFREHDRIEMFIKDNINENTAPSFRYLLQQEINKYNKKLFAEYRNGNIKTSRKLYIKSILIKGKK